MVGCRLCPAHSSITGGDAGIAERDQFIGPPGAKTATMFVGDTVY